MIKNRDLINNLESISTFLAVFVVSFRKFFQVCDVALLQSGHVETYYQTRSGINYYLL